MKIKRIYIGVPEELRSKVFWVERGYRVNELSFVLGGSDIIVEYQSGKVYGYDWVKYPGRYLNAVFERDFFKGVKDEDRLAELRKHVRRIFIRKYDGLTIHSEGFSEVWNESSSRALPFELLDKFTPDTYEEFLAFFLQDLDFANEYLSTHYPFHYYFLIDHWELIKKGSAHYTVFLGDTDSIFFSDIGLSFNKNIKWNSKLRAKFDYGFIDPFVGYIIGTGGFPVEHEERDFLDQIIPLDIGLELEHRNEAIVKHWMSVLQSPDEDANGGQGPDVDDINELNEEYQYLSFQEFKKLVQSDRFKVIVNESVWRNTLSNIIDKSFCELVYEKNRNTL